MTTPAATNSQAVPTAEQVLADLRAGFLGMYPSDYALVAPADVPEPFHQLLVHRKHMTVVLEQYYAQSVHLQVQWSQATGTNYLRRITLTAGSVPILGSDRMGTDPFSSAAACPAGGLVVELGIVRLELSMLPAEVRAEILAESTPLGRILINHGILRRVIPYHYLRFAAASRVIGLFGLPVPPLVYGRIGTILCNEQPAIELLEIVTGVAPSPLPPGDDKDEGRQPPSLRNPRPWPPGVINP
jgi:hypothetical protein